MFRPWTVLLLTALLVTPATALAQPVYDIDLPDLTDIAHTGPVNQVHGYVVGFRVCNVGTADAAWVSSTNQHPVEGWSMYRLADGRLEQIGISWLKHGFFAASSPGCTVTPCNGHNGAALGIGCSDSYESSLNQYQTSLGPRHEVNPATGNFPYPFSNPAGATGDSVFKYCQVQQADLTTPGARYLVEGLLVQPQEAQQGRGVNSVSYRLITVAANYVASMSGATARQSPAILAWHDHGLGTGVPDPAVTLTSVDIPGDGRLWIGSKAADLGGGLWRYDYAVENLTSDRAVRLVRVPMPWGATAVNPGFHDVAYHSGELQHGDDWAFDFAPGSVTCSTESYTGPFPGNALTANAIRWGTLYNVWFETHAPPTTGQVTLGLFRPGTPTSVAAAGVMPGRSPCQADADGNGVLAPADIGTFVSLWSTSLAQQQLDADFDGDGAVSPSDVAGFVSEWFAELGHC